MSFLYAKLNANIVMKMIVLAPRSGNPFVPVPIAIGSHKDCNGFLRQFALSGSGAGLAPEKIMLQ